MTYPDTKCTIFKEEVLVLYIRYLFFILVLLLGFATTGAAQRQQVDLNLIKATVAVWSEAHNTRDQEALEKLYAPSLLFYTKEISRPECIQIKLNRLNSLKSYHQEITSSLVNTVYQSGIIKCDFITTVTSGSMITEHKSYLLLQKKNSTYQIVGESDLETDNKFNYQLELGNQYKLNELELGDFSKMTSSDWAAVIKWLISATVALITLVLIYKKVGESKKAEKTTALSNNQIPFNQARKVNHVIYYRNGEPVWKPHRAQRSRQYDYRRFQVTNDSAEAAIKKKKGDEFEAFIFERFDRKYFKIRYWNGDLSHKGFYPESNMYPDLEIEFKLEDFKRSFAVECKFRSKLLNNSFELETRQLDNYRKYGREKSMRVYIAVGLHGVPTNPKKLYLIPLEIFATRNSLSYEELAKFERAKNYFSYDRKYDMLR